MAGTTLAEIKKDLPRARVAKASDVLTSEELMKIRVERAKGTPDKRAFDAVDAYVSEIISYFGWDAYRDWDGGEIDEAKMERLVAAERARRAEEQLELELVIANMVAACIRRYKNEKVPEGPKRVQKILKEKAKRVKGDR